MYHIKELFSLKGKIAIVTGGAGWLGSSISEALAEAGAHVVIASRNLKNCCKKAEAISKNNPRALGVKLDITKEESIQEMVDKVIKDFGKIDILVNNGGSGTFYAKDNIRVNAISPGAFPHPEIQKHQKFIKNLSRKIPLNRIGQPYELKGAVVFLASKASFYVTGHNLVVDGGWTVW